MYHKHKLNWVCLIFRDVTISSDSGSETEIEERIFAYNKNSLPKITDIDNLGKNETNHLKIFEKRKRVTFQKRNGLKCRRKFK